MKRVLMTLILGWLVGLFLFFVYIADGYARTLVGYKTKAVCSEIFVANRDLDDVLARDFERIHPAVEKVDIEADYSAGEVRGSLLGILGRSLAKVSPQQGCTLISDGPIHRYRTEWPDINPDPWSVNIDAEIQALSDAVLQTGSGDTSADVRAVVIVKDGSIVAESYADGFGPDLPMQSWSMAKSVTQALAAIAIDRGYLALDDTALMPGWTGDDRRAEITVENLLHMTDGLDFDEDYADPQSDVTRMLFGSRNMGLSASQAASGYAPGSRWAYSSGTSNILSAVLRQAIEEAGSDYISFPARSLFGPIGAESAVFETDTGGTFIGSSYLYASPRDWARLGQLYLDDGVWKGRRILPEGVVEFATTPALPDSAPFYGAHWWLNAPLHEGEAQRLPGFPEDAYYMGGHDVQRVIVIPSKNAVIVRLGMTRPPVDDARDVGPAMAAIYDAL